MLEQNKQTVNRSDYPKIPELLVSRLEDEFGSVVTSINNPTEIHAKRPSNITAMIKVEKSSQVEVGDILLIYDFLRRQIIAAEVEGHIIKSVDESRTDEHLFNEEAQSGYQNFKEGYTDFLRTPHLFVLEPIKLLDIENGRLVSKGSVKFAPCPKAPLFQPLDSEMQTILGVQEEGINFGVLARENDYWYFKKPDNHEEYLMPIKLRDEMLTRHISINGVSGAGKTLYLKYIVQQLQKADKTVLLTDTQGDFVAQLFKQHLKDWQKKELNQDQRTLELLKSATGVDYSNVGIDADKIQVFYPPYVNPRDDVILWELGRNNIRTFPLSIPSSLISSWAILAMIMPDLNATQIQGLDLLFNEFIGLPGEGQEGNMFNLQRFVQWIDNRSSSDDAGPQIRSARYIAPGTMRVIMRNLRRLLNKNILDTSPNPTTYEHLMRDGYVNILYLPGDQDDVDTRPLIQLLIYNEIYRNRTKSSEQRFIIIDEAQEVIPAERSSARDRIAQELSSQFRTLAEQGRKYGLSLIVASQQPRRMHKSVFSQCSTRIFMKLTSEDIDHLRREIPDQFKDSLVQLERGTALLVSPEEIERGQVWVKYPMPSIFHQRPNELQKELKEQRKSLRDQPTHPAKSGESDPF